MRKRERQAGRETRARQTAYFATRDMELRSKNLRRGWIRELGLIKDTLELEPSFLLSLADFCQK